MADRVVLYARAGCHLCDRAREVLLAARAEHRFTFEEIDVESSETLELDYGIRIPVIEIDGAEAFEVEVDPRALRAALGA